MLNKFVDYLREIRDSYYFRCVVVFDSTAISVFGPLSAIKKEQNMNIFEELFHQIH